jgi:TRAP transporter TAXI family solute receptor
LGRGLAQVLTRHVPDVEVTVEIGNASLANINLISKRRVALAIVQNDIAYYAVRGDKLFERPVKNLRMIASLYPEYVQCIAAKASGVKTISDLKGKRVSVGAQNSGVADSLSMILPAAGIERSDMQTVALDFAHTAEGIRDGRLDVGFAMGGYPISIITALAAQKEIDLVSFEDDLLERLTKTYPFFVKDVIPVGVYPGVNHATWTPAVMATLVCDSALPDSLVYGITKAIFENLNELKPAHEKAKWISLNNALAGAAIGVHPGAAKYYAEKSEAFSRY